MAGDWIKMRADLHTHPKVVRIASALNADRLRVIGALHAVWSVFDAHSTDGKLPGYSMDAMDGVLGWPGFCAAMRGVGWLEPDGDCGLQMPEFTSHNGKSAKRRANESERKRVSRDSPQNDRKSSASNADKKRTREEKRREGKPSGEPKGSPVENPKGFDLSTTNPLSATDGVTPTASTWDAYCQAFTMRYGVAPVRNATVNGQLANFVKRLGAGEAPQVAVFYLTHNHRRYVESKHPVGLMVQFAETLRTEWKTGARVDGAPESVADHNRRVAEEAKRERAARESA